VGALKYGHADMRDVLERASARETAMRVALGSVARRLLEELKVCVASRVVRIGAVADDGPAGDVSRLNARADASPVRSLRRSEDMVRAIERARASGDTLGGIVEVLADGLPVGLGSCAQWDRRLGGRIAAAFMGLNAIKGWRSGWDSPARRWRAARSTTSTSPPAAGSRTGATAPVGSTAA